jgi:hydrogenase nickel incorporation protein HypA/HybF
MRCPKWRSIVHELSIATQLVELVMQHLPDEGALVTRVRLRIGALSCVHADALRFGFELLTEGTPLQGAALADRGGARFDSLRDLQIVETIEGIQDFRCPRCQTPSADIRSGQELDLESIEVIEQESEPTLH